MKLEVGGVTEQVSVDCRSGNDRHAHRRVQDDDQLASAARSCRRSRAIPYDLVALSGNVKQASTEEGALVGGEQGGRGTGFSINGAAHGQHEHPARRRRQQLPVHRGHRSGDPARRRAGVLGHHQQLLGAVRTCHAAASSTSITKSGTNRFTGTGYEFFRNEKLASNSPDNDANDIEKGKFKRNQIGYSFGGPIVKDKVHFFSSLEYIGIRSTDTLISWVADAGVPERRRAPATRATSTPTARARRSTVRS